MMHELPTMPSFMKHLVSNAPNLGFLSNVVRALMECYPDTKLVHILEYVNSWPGICGKLSESDLQLVRHSA